MHADVFEIRALARRIRELGADVRADAHDLVARAHGVGWTGLSGAEMAAQALGLARVLRAVADQHETAARTLEAHAAAVEDALHLVAAIERRVHAAVDAARARLGRFVDGLLDAVDPRDEVLAAFTAPPPGSPEWLKVRLPGVPLPGSPR